MWANIYRCINRLAHTCVCIVLFNTIQTNSFFKGTIRYFQEMFINNFFFAKNSRAGHKYLSLSHTFFGVLIVLARHRFRLRIHIGTTLIEFSLLSTMINTDCVDLRLNILCNSDHSNSHCSRTFIFLFFTRYLYFFFVTFYQNSHFH